MANIIKHLTFWTHYLMVFIISWGSRNIRLLVYLSNRRAVQRRWIWVFPHRPKMSTLKHILRPSMTIWIFTPKKLLQSSHRILLCLQKGIKYFFILKQQNKQKQTTVQPQWDYKLNSPTVSSQWRSELVPGVLGINQQKVSLNNTNIISIIKSSLRIISKIVNCLCLCNLVKWLHLSLVSQLALSQSLKAILNHVIHVLAIP